MLFNLCMRLSWENKNNEVRFLESEKDLQPGALVRVRALDNFSRPNYIKLYRDTESLRLGPFIGYQTHLILNPGESQILMIVDTTQYQAMGLLQTKDLLAVRVILESKLWWLHAFDIAEVVLKGTQQQEETNSLLRLAE